jgi:regulator of CtrA degradation
MSSSEELIEPEGVTTEPVSFGRAFAQSAQFDQVFIEGMALVEQAAAYLDGAGRADSRRLKVPVSTVYATESMRMTTRLLEVASWLLVQRALKTGEISADEADGRRRRIKLCPSGRPSHIKHFDDLPAALRDLIVASFQITDRLVQIDRAMPPPAGADTRPLPAVTRNPVGAQLSTIRSAFRVIDGGRS